MALLEATAVVVVVVTCLICPSQERRGSVNIESIDNNLSEATGKKQKIEE